ncbi:unnamed protein product [Closterium sp. Yama58-4]|nr:unnamed protein product [Closterium sp. Yama58-4]
MEGAMIVAGNEGDDTDSRAGFNYGRGGGDEEESDVPLSHFLRERAGMTLNGMKRPRKAERDPGKEGQGEHDGEEEQLAWLHRQVEGAGAGGDGAWQAGATGAAGAAGGAGTGATPGTGKKGKKGGAKEGGAKGGGGKGAAGQENSGAGQSSSGNHALMKFPIPYCSCTGHPRQVHRNGHWGWQSACCTNSLSQYPLPPHPTRRHNRMCGRRMSASAFLKLAQRLEGEGMDVRAVPIDLCAYWGKHGYNQPIAIATHTNFNALAVGVGAEGNDCGFVAGLSGGSGSGNGEHDEVRDCDSTDVL